MGIWSDSILDLAEALLRLEWGRSSTMRQSSWERLGGWRACGSRILCGFMRDLEGIFLRVSMR
jgi:hypothetical protein